MKRVAVILSGCGVFDGSEIHEATAALLALDRADAEVTVCAPSGPQMHVINHQTGQPADGESRDIRVESARIARGPVADLKSLNAADFDAVVLPGGFGAAKNLSTFAVDGPDCTVNPHVEAFLKAAHAGGKTIGAMCIAPAVLARIFGASLQPTLTIGKDQGTAAAIRATGSIHQDAAADEVVVDMDNRIVTTPAYMMAGRISEVFDGADKFIAAVLRIS